MSDKFEAVSISYDCTPAELYEASRILALSPVGAVRWARAELWRGIAGWVIFFVVGAILLHSLQPAAKPKGAGTSQPIPADRLIAIALFSIGAASGATGLLLRSRVHRAQLQRWGGHLTFTFDGGGLTQRRPGRTERFRWLTFRSVDESPNVFVLRTEAKKGFVIPLRLFADSAELDRVRLLLKTRIVRPAITLSVGFEVERP